MQISLILAVVYAASLALATPEAYGAQYPDMDFSDEEIEKLVSAGTREGPREG